MKNYIQILVVMIQENKEYTRKEIVARTILTLEQVHGSLRFLKKCNFVNFRYVKTDSKPYRKVLYSLNMDKDEKILKLVSKEVNLV